MKDHLFVVLGDLVFSSTFLLSLMTLQLMHF